MCAGVAADRGAAGCSVPPAFAVGQSALRDTQSDVRAGLSVCDDLTNEFAAKSRREELAAKRSRREENEAAQNRVARGAAADKGTGKRLEPVDRRGAQRAGHQACRFYSTAGVATSSKCKYYQLADVTSRTTKHGRGWEQSGGATQHEPLAMSAVTAK